MEIPKSIFTIPPLFFITSAYILGICGQYTGYHLTLAPFFVGSSLIIIYLIYKYRPAYPSIILFLLTFAAYPLGSFLLHRQKKEAVQFYNAVDKKQFDIEGTIADISYIDNNLFNAIITLESVSLKERSYLETSWHQYAQKIQIYTHRPKNIYVADQIELRGIKISRPLSTSYQHYLLKEGICATIFTQKNKIQLMSRPAYSINRSIAMYRDAVCGALERKMSASGFSVFCPLFLGKRNIGKKETMQRNTELFTTWGITHYLARSGLHLIVLITLWLFVFNCLPISFNKKQWLLVSASIIYFLLSWSSIPFYRALATLIFHRLCLLFRLQSNFLHLLILTCFSILLLNPIQFFFLDFQLSFGLTFALACFSHINGYKKINIAKQLHLQRKLF
jgi:competence protein ComEC